MRHSRPTLLSLAFLVVFILSGCVQTVQQTSKMYVKDLVQSDVFEVLPENDPEILIYENAEDIQGEYLELATVQVQVSSYVLDASQALQKVQDEADALGANAILLLEETTYREGRTTNVTIKGIAIFALDVIPNEVNNEMAFLPS